MSGIRVLKFGGAALRDGPAVRRACDVVVEHGGERPIVVVSAVQGVTAELEALARGGGDFARLRVRHRSLLRELGLSSELLDRYLAELARIVEGQRAEAGTPPGPARGPNLGPAARRRADHLLSFGERMSARIVAAALREAGRPATPVDAWDLGLVTRSHPVSAAALPALGPATLAGVRRSLAEVPGIPVVTGFLAADERGDLTTLGRNGSDLTALLLAVAAEVDEVQLWKSVAGIQTADPARVPGAQTLPALGYAEALALALHGARVVHPDAVRLAREHGLRVRLLDVRDPAAGGTELVATTPVAGPLALACRTGLVRADLATGALPALLAALDLDEVGGPWVEARAGRARLTVADRPDVRAQLEAHGAEVVGRVASLAVVGRAPLAEDALAEVVARLAAGGEHANSRAWIVAEDRLEPALVAAHAALRVETSEPLPAKREGMGVLRP